MNGNTEINKDTFWALMAEAKAVCGPDLYAEDDWLKEQLQAMWPGEALRFHHIAQRYLQLSNKYGLWSAARLMSDCCIDTDSSFTNFQSWLIAQGKDIYLAALKDPDSLAVVEPYGGCSFDSLYFVGGYVYEGKTGCRPNEVVMPRGLQEELNALAADIVYAPNINYPLEWNELEAHLPRLCARYMPSEQIRANAILDPMWNPADPEIQFARKRYKPLKEPVKAKNPRKKGGDAR